MLKYLTLSAAVLTLTACSSFTDYQTPHAPEGLYETSLEQSVGDNDRIGSAAPVTEWWNSFDDPKLGGLVETALQHNHDIRIAYANLDAARAIVRETGFDRFPSADLNASYARERLSEEGINGAPADSSVNTYSAGFDAGWELDLFGRVSNRVEAADAERDAVVADLRAVQVTIAAEVARSYMELRGAQYRLDIAARNADNQRQTVRLTKDLQRGGVGSGLDIARAETQLELTEATIPSREAEVTAAINRLSVLTGQVPDALRGEFAASAPLPSLPAQVMVGQADQLIKQRPDIQRAERELAAATARYNVAVADQFPAVNIVGSLGFLATNLSSFGSGSALAGAVGPSLNWGVFDFGRIRSRIDQNDAWARAALAGYEQTVLHALEETQTAISDFSQEERRRARLQNAAYSAVKASTLARQRFELGDTNFLAVLDSERVRLETEDAIAVSEIDSALNLVRIYKALGQGWDIDQKERAG